MPSPVFKRYEQILQGLINMVVSRSALTDITDASVYKHILAATAREIDEAYFQMGLLPDLFSVDSAVGDDLDDRAAEIQPPIIFRTQATKAVGQVVFSRSGTAGLVTIPAGTVLKTAAGVLFQTTAAASIPDMATVSGAAATVAQVGGSAGNVVIGSIVKFDSKPPGVDAVTNAVNFVGGTDKETDDSFRRRIKSFVATLARSTKEALEFISVGVTIPSGQRVRFSHVFEDPYNRGEVTLYIDDGSGTAELTQNLTAENLCQGLAGPPPDSAVGGERFLQTNFKPLKLIPAPVFTSSLHGALTANVDYILDDASGQLYFLPASPFYVSGLTAAEVITAASYTAFAGLVAEVQKIIDGDPNDRDSYPGWRAAGVRVRVTVPAVLQQVVIGSLLVQEGYIKVDVITAVQEVVADYINNLGISGDVLLSELIQRVMEVSGVVNCSISTPASDVILLDDQLPRILAPNILFT